VEQQSALTNPGFLLYGFENKGGMLRRATLNKDSSGAVVTFKTEY
jgi:hypothetical protein